MTARKISLSDLRSKTWDDLKVFSNFVEDRHVAIYVAASSVLLDPHWNTDDVRNYCADRTEELRKRLFASPFERALRERMALLWEEFSSLIED